HDLVYRCRTRGGASRLLGRAGGGRCRASPVRSACPEPRPAERDRSCPPPFKTHSTAHPDPVSCAKAECTQIASGVRVFGRTTDACANSGAKTRHVRAAETTSTMSAIRESNKDGKVCMHCRHDIGIRRAVLLTIATAGAVAVLYGAMPASGSLSPTSGPVSWDGPGTGGTSPDGEATCLEGTNCDTFTLTIAPGDYTGKRVRF